MRQKSPIYKYKRHNNQSTGGNFNNNNVQYRRNLLEEIHGNAMGGYENKTVTFGLN